MTDAREPECIRSGFEFVEGPVWVCAGSPLLAGIEAPGGALVFSDIPASRLHWLAGNRTGVLREATGQANGNALDRDGALLSCEHANRRVSRFDGAGPAVCLVDRYGGKRLNSPNDLAVRSDGMVFFTDPPYGVRDEDRELDLQGVYGVRPGADEPVLLAEDFVKPNGLAFSADERFLYVADTERGHVRRFEVAADGRLAGGRRFCDCERPDGLCIDRADRVWVACMDGLEIFDADGTRAASVPLPERPANLAFGDADLKSVYICARTGIYRVRSAVAGVAPA